MPNVVQIVTILCVILYTASTVANLCPKQNLCKCKFHGQETDLHCTGIGDLLDLRECLKEHFHDYYIRSLFVRDCNATSLPAGIIQNLTVRMLDMECPLLNVSVDAFVGSYKGFLEFRLHRHKLTVIPNAFLHSPKMRRLWISNGTLESVGEQLRNLTNLQILSLIKNRIQYISPNAFSSLTSLLGIYLSDNVIKYLPPNVFASCWGITTITLSNNYLASAEGLLNSLNPKTICLQNNNLTDIHIFHPRMWHTKELDISGNPVGKIDNSIFLHYFVNLKILDMSNMGLTYISEDAFPYFPALTELDLSINEIEVIHNRTFNNLPLLNKLNLSKNKLASITGIFDKHYKLKILDVSFNRIVDLEDSLNGVPNLSQLHVGNNRILALTDENFKRLSGLQKIYAKDNGISIITKDCFKYLPLLNIIDLTSNRLTTLNGSIQNIPMLNRLYLSFNHIEKLQDDDLAKLPELEFINFMGNPLISLNGQIKYLHSLRYLNLKNNMISSFARETFPTVIPIKTLYMEGNPLICDCRLEWLNLWAKKYKYLKDNPICQEPYWLKGRYFKNTSISDLVDWKESCPSPCKCFCVPNGLERGIYVNCSNNNLTDIPDMFPSGMIGLDLSYNNLTIFQIPFLNSSWFYRLQELNVENNKITSIQGLPFLKYLSVLMLANNRLETLAVKSTSNYSIVTLAGNPWLCDCSTLWFRNWLFTLKDEILDVNQTKCEKGNVKDEFLDTPIIYLSESQICPQKIALYISLSIGILAFLLLISSSTVTYFRYRLNIKIWLYAHGFTCVKEEDIDKDKQFDAFVSYSSYDEKFVLQILRPTLESGSPAYFLCIHERNFPVGKEITESIISAVKSSKRTILVLSRNFLASEWCTMEFRTAHLQALKDKINRVIIIVYGELPPEKEIEEELQVYLKSTTYLIWGEKYFWQKLRYALPKVKKDRELVELHYDEDVQLLVGY